MNNQKKIGVVMLCLFTAFLGGGFIYFLIRSMNFEVENINLKNNYIQDSTSTYKKDVIIRDYANINLQFRQWATEYPSLEMKLKKDTTYTNISSKYN